MSIEILDDSVHEINPFRDPEVLGLIDGGYTVIPRPMAASPDGAGVDSCAGRMAKLFYPDSHSMSGKELTIIDTDQLAGEDTLRIITSESEVNTELRDTQVFQWMRYPVMLFTINREDTQPKWMFAACTFEDQPVSSVPIIAERSEGRFTYRINVPRETMDEANEITSALGYSADEVRKAYGLEKKFPEQKKRKLAAVRKNESASTPDMPFDAPDAERYLLRMQDIREQMLKNSMSEAHDPILWDTMTFELLNYAVATELLRRDTSLFARIGIFEPADEHLRSIGARISSMAGIAHDDDSSVITENEGGIYVETFNYPSMPTLLLPPHMQFVTPTQTSSEDFVAGGELRLVPRYRQPDPAPMHELSDSNKAALRVMLKSGSAHTPPYEALLHLRHDKGGLNIATADCVTEIMAIDPMRVKGTFIKAMLSGLSPVFTDDTVDSEVAEFKPQDVSLGDVSSGRFVAGSVTRVARALSSLRYVLVEHDAETDQRIVRASIGAGSSLAMSASGAITVTSGDDNNGKKTLGRRTKIPNMPDDAEVQFTVSSGGTLLARTSPDATIDIEVHAPRESTEEESH